MEGPGNASDLEPFVPTEARVRVDRMGVVVGVVPGKVGRRG